MLDIIAVEMLKQLITSGLQGRGKSQDFKCDFKLDWEHHSRKLSKEMTLHLPHELDELIDHSQL